MRNLLKQKNREIDLDRDSNLRKFDLRAHKNIKIEEKTHVQRGPSSRIDENVMIMAMMALHSNWAWRMPIDRQSMNSNFGTTHRK
jgi:hypothetical protein